MKLVHNIDHSIILNHTSSHPFNLTRILMFNTPSAPLGKVFRRQELESIAEVLRRHPQILIIADEARTLKCEHMFGVQKEMVQVIWIRWKIWKPWRSMRDVSMTRSSIFILLPYLECLNAQWRSLVLGRPSPAPAGVWAAKQSWAYLSSARSIFVYSLVFPIGSPWFLKRHALLRLIDLNLSLRSGYVIAPAVLAAPLLATHTAVNFCAPTPLQKASAAAFERAEKEGYFHWMAEMMQELSREDVPLCSVSWVFICSMPCFSSLSLLSILIR